MGLIKAGAGALGGTLADQWKEFFYCDAIDSDTLVVKGEKKTSRRSSNTKGEDNIISNGSGIAVANGQCMIIVEQGKVVEACAEPGEFTYDSSTEPSIFTGNLEDSIRAAFSVVGKRFAYGGDTGKDQRVYYVNIKEIVENKFGTVNPIPFRVVDRNIGLDIDVSVRCNGVYSYRITNPLLFYANVCGNVEERFDREEIETQLKTEFLSALQPSFAKISEMGIRPNAIPGHTEQLAEAMNEALTKKWSELRGISMVSIALNSVTLPEEDADMIKQVQRNAIMRDPSMAAATLAGAQADAMKAAASNANGAMTGFMGMGMAVQSGGMNMQNLYQMGAQNQTAQNQAAQNQTAQNQTAQNQTAQNQTAQNQAEQNQQVEKQPEANAQPNGWTCSCGTVNKGKFCMECGQPKPAGALLYRCDKCGWEPEDPKHPPKFCPECGDVLNENDRQ